MIASIAEEGQETRAAPFGHALVKLAEQRPEVVGMTADSVEVHRSAYFRSGLPGTLLSDGHGRAVVNGGRGRHGEEGLIPFATTYAVFATRRAYDFIHQVIAEEHLNVKMCAALPGLTTGYGPSHQATEDIAIMRGIPGMTIINPCDAIDTEQAVPAMAAHDGPVYMRLLRGKVPVVLDQYNYQFKIGKAALLEEGNDVLIVASGLMTMRALEAAKQLRKDNVSVAALRSPTIKPLDEETILAQAAKPGRLVIVAENHSSVGGLCEAVASLLMRNRVNVDFDTVALPDAFLDAGALPTLHDRYGISTTAMVEKIRRRL